MKKFISMVLVLVLMLGVSAVAFAVDSPTAAAKKTDTTSSLPEFAMSEENTAANLVLTSFEDEANLADEQKAVFDAAKKDVANVTPDGAACQYIFFATADAWPQMISVKIDNATEVTAMQYAGEAWEDVPVEGADGIYTLTVAGEGAVAIFTK